MMATRALVGRFDEDARGFRARPVRVDGQPTWTLQQLARIYTTRFSGDAAVMHRVLMGQDWSTLNAGTTAAVDDRFVYVPGIGRSYPPDECGAPVGGDRVTDEPWGAGEWLYLWEHAYGALHTFVSGAGRWHHLATMPRDLLARADRKLLADIEVREWWVREAW